MEHGQNHGMREETEWEVSEILSVLNYLSTLSYMGGRPYTLDHIWLCCSHCVTDFFEHYVTSVGLNYIKSLSSLTVHWQH